MVHESRSSERHLLLLGSEQCVLTYPTAGVQFSPVPTISPQLNEALGAFFFQLRISRNN